MRNSIQEEEIQNHPEDVDARLTAIEQRMKAEIDPRAYAFAIDTQRYCSGREISGPLRSGTLHFYMAPADMPEFADLIQTIKQTCEAVETG